MFDMSRPTSGGARALTRIAVSVCVLAAATSSAGAFASPAAQGPEAGLAAVARAFFDALATGDPARFEAMAQRALRARAAGPPHAGRARADGRADPRRLRHDDARRRSATGNDEVLTLQVTGSTGIAGRIELTRRARAAAPHHDDRHRRRRTGRRATGPPPPPINAAMTPADLEKALDAYLAARASAGEFAGVVADRQGRQDGLPEGLRPRRSRARTRPSTAATRFNVASIGKAFTKAPSASSSAQGRLALTDTIGKLLPDYPNPKARAPRSTSC